MPAARAICASRCTAASISLPATIIRSAISSTTTTMNGNGSNDISSSSNTGDPVSRSNPVCTVRLSISPLASASASRWLKPVILRTPSFDILR